MWIVLVTCFAAVVGSTKLADRESTITRSTNEKSFEEKLKEGNRLLGSEPNADDTMKFLEKLHRMEKEIENKRSEPSESNSNTLKDYVEIENDHMEPMGDTIEEINRNSNVETALFQGDIMLTKEQAEEIMNDVEENEGTRKKRQAFRDQNYPAALWSRGLVYAFWNVSTTAREVFRKAALLWSWDTCINIARGHTATDRVDVIKGGGCWSYVGRLGGVQSLSLGIGCESVGTAAHEIGHALGLFHTQARHDRDNFITFYPQNLKDGWLPYFAKQTEQNNYNYNLTYDYGSVMHYGARDMSTNDTVVMMPRDEKYMQTLGSRIISFYDKLMVNMHYGCLDRCAAASSATCQNGGYPHPRHCHKCICPSGYGGNLCNEKPNWCGSRLTANASFQTLEDNLAATPRAPKSDDLKMCHYWIEAPADSKIEVVFDNFTQGFTYDGCVLAGVEIKTGSDKRHTGYRFCSPRNFGTSLVSTYNMVPVITYSSGSAIRTVLRYRIAPSTQVNPNSTSQSAPGPSTLSASLPNPGAPN